MTRDDRIALQEARRAILAIANRLDDSGTPCAACGLIKKKKWKESIAKESLMGSVKKIEHALRELQESKS